MDSDVPAIPGENHTPPLRFAAIVDGILRAVLGWGHLDGFTYSPKLDVVYDVTDRIQCKALYQELARGNRAFRSDLPIYLIAVTCHASIETDGILRHGYEKVAGKSNQPLIGYWRNPEGRVFLDAVLPAQFINMGGAIKEGKNHEQEFILRIGSDGTYDHIETD